MFYLCTICGGKEWSGGGGGRCISWTIGHGHYACNSYYIHNLWHAELIKCGCGCGDLVLELG